MKLLRFSILILCLLSSVKSFADDITYEVTTNYDTYSTYVLANAYDGKTNTYFWSNEAQATGKYILITFSDYVNLTSFSTSSTENNDYPNTCNELQVSSDGSTWTTIGPFQDAQTSTFSDITSANKIQYVRIYATSTISKWLVINEITMKYEAYVAPTQVDKTYTRSNVSTDTWESFCLPMNVDLDELQKYFDEIYIPYKGENFLSVEDTDSPTDGSGDIDSAAKRKSAALKASADGTAATITCTTESYSDETSYWTDEEEEEAKRYSFAYSAPGSKYYHFFIADFSKDDNMVIPQGTPFFAHVSPDITLTDNTLTINGYLWSGETEMTGIVDKSFKVYSDQSLTTVDTDKSFDAVGELTADDTFSVTGTLYAINPTNGSFVTTTEDNMAQNHAYLMVGADDAEGILVYNKTVTELLAITEINVTDPSENTLALIDSEPTLTPGSYKAGNVTYTRNGTAGYYGTFCMPFDVSLKAATCFDYVYVPHNLSLYNVDTERLRVFFKDVTDIADFGDVIPAGMPFIAHLTGNITLTNATAVTYTADESPTITDSSINIYNWNEGTGGLTPRNKDLRLVFTGAFAKKTYDDYDASNLRIKYFITSGAFKELSDDGYIPPFRGYMLLYNTSTAAVKAIDTDFSFDEESTAIKTIQNSSLSSLNKVYSIDGRMVKSNITNNNELDNLQPGIYFINGKKIIKK